MAFTFNQISSKSLGLFAYLQSWQIVPTQRNRTLSLAGRDGVLDLGCSSEAREIRLTLSIRQRPSTQDVMETLDQLAAWLSPDQGLKPLILDEFPDRFFMARIASLINYERILKIAGTLELVFFSPDPFGYALADDELTLSAEGAHDFVRTKGNAASFPTITVSGAFTEANRPVLRIAYSGSVLELSGVFPTGASLEIDTGFQTARFLDESGKVIGNGMPLIKEPVFPPLMPHSNVIQISGERLSLSGIRFKANSRWR